MISGARSPIASLLAKWYGKDGYDVILVDSFWWSGSRFSRYVKSFYIVKDEEELYIKDIVNICKKHKVTWYIPICQSSSSEKTEAKLRDQLV